MAIAREQGSGVGPRRRHQPVWPDRQPGAGHGLLQASAAGADIDPAAGSVLVEPGMTLGALNTALRPHGVFFPVDPSTHARCTIGGMAGNNSCGSKSIRYGLMADNVRAIDAILADGTRHRFGAVPGQSRRRHARAHRRSDPAVAALGASEADEIAAPFPETTAPRRRLQHRRADPRRARRRPRQPGAAAGGIGGHAGVLRRAGAVAASDQAAQNAGHLPVPVVSQGDGGGAPYRAARTPRRWNWSIAP